MLLTGDLKATIKIETMIPEIIIILIFFNVLISFVGSEKTINVKKKHPIESMKNISIVFVVSQYGEINTRLKGNTIKNANINNTA